MFNCFPFSWNQFRPRQGFRAQAAKWPRNPLDDVISSFAFDFFLTTDPLGEKFFMHSEVG